MRSSWIAQMSGVIPALFARLTSTAIPSLPVATSIAAASSMLPLPATTMSAVDPVASASLRSISTPPLPVAASSAMAASGVPCITVVSIEASAGRTSRRFVCLKAIGLVSPSRSTATRPSAGLPLGSATTLPVLLLYFAFASSVVLTMVPGSSNGGTIPAASSAQSLSLSFNA